MTVRYRVMTRADIAAGMRLTEIAGWNQTPTDWERFLSDSSDGCFVAEYLDRVIGTSATIEYGGGVAWVSMVLVDPRYRGQGVGTELLQRAVQHLDARGVPCIKLDATPLGRPIYEKSGFVSEYDVERWELRRKGSRPSIGQEPVPDLEDVLRMDREVFGADRGSLLRSVAEVAPDLTLARRNQGAIAGYTLGRRGPLADHLGPWVAVDEEIAASLLDEFLARSGRDLVFVDCIPSNAWVVPLLEARGFEFSRPLIRMCRGKNMPEAPDAVGAIVGPEFG